jgi:1,6-anhydro-N-acetylmuramate kinase
MSEQMAFDLPSPAAGSVLAIGLMSGTSQDGVDMALIDSDDIDGEELIACDTGPGNALLDRLSAAAHWRAARHRRPHCGKRHDR